MQAINRIFRDAYSPLQNHNLALYLGSQTISFIGTFMQATAQSWVVWQISHSTSDLGLVAMLGSIPMLLFGAFAGMWADRLDRRKVLIATQITSMLLAFLFAVLLQTQSIQLWHIYVLSFALGCVTALDMPTASAFVSDLSGIDQVRKAVVLNNMIVQISRMIGPALAGWLLSRLGITSAFWLNGASFLAVIGCLMVIRSQQVNKPAVEKKQGDMGEALRFVARKQRIQELSILCFLITFFGYSSGQLFPAIVTDYLHGWPELLGIILGASGAGALASAILVLPFIQRFKRPGWIISAALFWTGLCYISAVFANSSWMWVVGAFLGSLSGPIIMTSSNGLIQQMAPPDMKARMITIWIMISFGMQPFGFLLVGYSGRLLGAAHAILFNGLAMILGALAILLLRSGFVRWQPALPEGDISFLQYKSEEQPS
ncbi:MAG TPA: MFS transporter [Anaerolineaceae bacterium]|nr:MFS transporter [Anaerolineaceae bacterium]